MYVAYRQASWKCLLIESAGTLVESWLKSVCSSSFNVAYIDYEFFDAANDRWIKTKEASCVVKKPF